MDARQRSGISGHHPTWPLCPFLAISIFYPSSCFGEVAGSNFRNCVTILLPISLSVLVCNTINVSQVITFILDTCWREPSAVTKCTLVIFLGKLLNLLEGKVLVQAFAWFARLPAYRCKIERAFIPSLLLSSSHNTLIYSTYLLPLSGKMAGEGSYASPTLLFLSPPSPPNR